MSAPGLSAAGGAAHQGRPEEADATTLAVAPAGEAAADRNARAMQRLAELQRAAAGQAQEVFLRTAANTEGSGGAAAAPEVQAQSQETAAPASLGLAARAEDDPEGGGPPLCWICRDPDSPEPLIAPCQCRGTLRGVHASCMEAWLQERHRRRLNAVDANPLLADTRCDICRAPMQVVHQPAGRRAFLRAHLVTCWDSCLREAMPTVLLTIGAYVWLVGTMLLYAVPMSIFTEAAWVGDSQALVLLTSCLTVAWICLLFELLIVVISYPWSSRRPRNRCLGRCYFADIPWRPIVILLWAHLYAVAVVGLVLCIGLDQDGGSALRWALLAPVFVPPICPHAKAVAFACHACRTGHVGQACAAWWRSTRRRFCGPRCRYGCRLLGRMFFNPTYPWFHLLLAIVVGSCTAVVVGSTPPRWGLWSCTALCILAALAAVAAGAVVAYRGPLHPSFRFGAGHVHFAWWMTFAAQCYFAVLVPAVFGSLDRQALQAAAAVDWEALCGAASSWMAVIVVLALYTSIATCRAYCVRWQAAHGEARISGDVVASSSASPQAAV